MGIEIVTALVTVTVFIAVVGVRTYTAGRVAVTLNDAIISAIAAVLVLLITGKISKLGISGSGITLESIVLSASSEKIDKQVTTLSGVPLPVARIEPVGKGAAAAIPSLVQRHVEALEFTLGSASYDAGVTREHFEVLTKYPFFRFVNFVNPNNTMFGMMDARKLFALLQDQESGLTFEKFVNLANRGGTDERNQLEKLPGFLPAKVAVNADSDKREVLQKMENLGLEWLPVVGNGGRFEGIVERSRLTASIILDVTNRLKASAGP
jgi:hypothetical protein